MLLVLRLHHGLILPAFFISSSQRAEVALLNAPTPSLWKLQGTFRELQEKLKRGVSGLTHHQLIMMIRTWIDDRRTSLSLYVPIAKVGFKQLFFLVVNEPGMQSTIINSIAIYGLRSAEQNWNKQHYICNVNDRKEILVIQMLHNRHCSSVSDIYPTLVCGT